MVNVRKEKKGNVLVVHLAGSLGEGTNFNELIGETPSELEINCKDVLRINSMGVKAWINYFQAANAAGKKIKFVECSTAIVKQINLISNFTCGGTVVSLYAPFSCTSCKTEFNSLLRMEDIQAHGEKIPEAKCSKCGQKAVFDDIREEYFAFIER